MGNHFHVSKIDAAKRQLEAAIRLFFQSSDVVVIHTLIGATHNILTDLAKKQGITSGINDGIRLMIKKEKQKEVYDKIHEAKNFFKHADRNADKTIDFSPTSSEFYIYDCCGLYQALTQEALPLIRLFRLWFYCKNSDLVLDDKFKEIYQNLNSNVSYEDRSTYLKILPFLEKDSMQL